MKPIRFQGGDGTAYWHGLTEGAAVAAATRMATHDSPPLAVVVLPEMGSLDRWESELQLHLCAIQPNTDDIPGILVLPEPVEGSDEEENPEQLDRECDRLTALTQLLQLGDAPVRGEQGQTRWVLTTPRGFFTPVPPPDTLLQREISLRVGADIPFQELVDALGERLGYSHEAVCENPGQYAVRGGLVDIYPVNATAPLRVDFFGDQIEGIRRYDPTTQRSEEHLSEVIIAALAQSREPTKSRNIFAYLPRRVSWFFWEPTRLAEKSPVYFEEFERKRSLQPTFADLNEDRQATGDHWHALAEFDQGEPWLEAFPRREVLAESIQAHRFAVAESILGADRKAAEEENRARFLALLREWEDNGEAIHLVCFGEEEVERVRATLNEFTPSPRAPLLLRGRLHEGFRLEATGLPGTPPFPSQPVVYVSARELFGRTLRTPVGIRRRRLPRRARVDQLLDFSELAEGDYLVHLAHGICRFRGLAKIELRGRPEEVISLEFAEDITLHLPLYESHLLSRYVGLGKARPQLAKLGGNQWGKTRKAAERATLDYAATLLSLQAERESTSGFAFSPDGDWARQFAESFPFTETPDQSRTIREVRDDMERERPMDRLVCGDVGYGKTEVAIRAAFKAVLDGKQVAVLVPTTVLAQQHFQTFRERMAAFPVTVEMISRFRNRTQQEEILRQARTGRIDILIGTHRLLSKDLAFRDLGVLVIDEEHRFGVRHKELLKQWRAHVDVITMSATPIPRTLYLAMMGARDLSVIETPPVDRLPIRTAVKPYSPEFVREAIRFEVDRGGQVFYLHNRVQTIDSVALRIQELCPDLRIAVGHGQMTENALEKIMTQFVAGEFDVLVCTTIIESGLDIPNCNTILVEGADRFGLSQLYQLRGRVGRFNRQAYCYLLLHRHARMLGKARDRLSALRQYNQLGAGFKIAMRDLELRGAGNLLGAQQSGHIAGVGFDLYCQLLRQSIARIKGEPQAQHIRATIRLDFVLVGEGDPWELEEERPHPGYHVLKEEELAAHRIEAVRACLPREYLQEIRLRIDFYRRLAMCASLEDLENIRESLLDRFGTPPEPVETLLLVTELRLIAEQKSLASVETEGNRLKCLRASNRPDDFVQIGRRFPRLTARNPRLRLHEIKNFLLRHV